MRGWNVLLMNVFPSPLAVVGARSITIDGAERATLWDRSVPDAKSAPRTDAIGRELGGGCAIRTTTSRSAGPQSVRRDSWRRLAENAATAECLWIRNEMLVQNSVTATARRQHAAPTAGTVRRLAGIITGSPMGSRSKRAIASALSGAPSVATWAELGGMGSFRSIIATLRVAYVVLSARTATPVSAS